MTDLLGDAPLSPASRSLRFETTDIETYYGDLRDRIERIDPTIRAFVDEENRWGRVDRAIDRVRARFPDPEARPPLYGVPVGIKDVFQVAGLETRAGSRVPPEELSEPEAEVVSALTDAGAIVLGKTVTAEFACFEPGPTRNPHDPEHTPGGSSSGSVAAVAAGLCPLALGTQTIGSTNRPAGFCGIVGVKPSYGRIPAEGTIAVAPSLDHVGFFTGDVAGAELAAGVLYEDWRAGDAPPELSRIGVLEGPYLEQAGDVARDHFGSHVDRLEASGYETVRVDPFENIDRINDRHETVMAAEMAIAHEDRFSSYGDRYSESTAEFIREGRDVSVQELASGRTGRSALRDRLHDTFETHDLDVLVSPAAPGPAPEGLDSTGDPIMNLPWTHSGLPTVTVPASKTDAGLPMGLQCSTRFGRDEWLLPWCRSIEKALR